MTSNGDGHSLRTAPEGRLIGESFVMLQFKRLVRLIGPTEATVLITGLGGHPKPASRGHLKTGQ